MKKVFAILAVILIASILAGCAGMGRRSIRGSMNQDQIEDQEDGNRMPGGGNPGQKVLRTGQKLAIDRKIIIIGNCWDFVNAVFIEAGYPQGKRKIIFQGSTKGPYADPELLKPGDWVMHINMEYNGVDHSSIFVRWVDRGRHIAKVMDYAGMNKVQPGGYDEHAYTKIFCILRAVER